jgi:hypothetical protein
MTNNYYYDYIGSTGSYPINDYIDTEINLTSNILNTKIDITSNILENHSSNYTDANITILDNKYNKLIKTVDENITTPNPLTLKHTTISNSNIQGQIRFITRFDTNDYRYKTRIKENGEIEVYYENFNPIYPTMFVGWYNVMGSIRDAYNYQNIATELIGGALIAINDLYNKFYGLVSATGAALSSITGGQMTQLRFAQITAAASKAVNYQKFSELQALLGITGLGIAGIAASVFNGVAYDTSVRNILLNKSVIKIIVLTIDSFAPCDI